jgi:predicted RNA-binding protein (virulence factor B family)
MIHPGRFGKLQVVRIESQGLWLYNRDEEEVFLPYSECPQGIQIGDILEVFVFPNEKGRMEASIRKPLLTLNEVRKLRVKDATPHGAFVDIGIRADLFMPPGEQQFKVESGREYVVIMRFDAERKKLYGSTRIPRYLSWNTRDYERGDQVDIILLEKEEESFKVVVNQKTLGSLPFSETFRQVRMGETYKAYVKKVEPKILIISLQKEGFEQIEDAAVKIIDYLKMNGGYARLNDDTDPEEIKLRLHMSKKAFKKAIGHLQKLGEIQITKRGIKLTKSQETTPENI